MEIGLAFPYAEGAMAPSEVEELARAADDLGMHSLWVAEAWSFDAFMLLTSLAQHTTRVGLGTAIVNVYSRTPALIAQSLATLDALSGGRALLGLGASGPQVIEGWHGVPYDKPLRRTRETVDIVRTILRRERLDYEGTVFRPRMGLKLINHPVRNSVPVVVAALGPKNVALAAEIADGWMPTLFSPTKGPSVFRPALDEGRSRRSPELAPMQIFAPAAVAVTERPEVPRAIARHMLALYIGGMGSREKNFYKALIGRYGYEDAATRIQDLYLSGKRDDAAQAVPDELVDDLSLIGPAGYVKDKLAQFAEAGVDVLIASPLDMDHRGRMATLEELQSLA